MGVAEVTSRGATVRVWFVIVWEVFFCGHGEERRIDWFRLLIYQVCVVTQETPFFLFFTYTPILYLPLIVTHKLELQIPLEGDHKGCP